MALVPGRIYVESTVRIPVNYEDASHADTDPDTVTFKLYSPSGVVSTYVYGTDAEINRSSVGDYYIDVVPTESGRWFYRWVSTGTFKASAVEGTFVVQASPFFDQITDAYRS